MIASLPMYERPETAAANDRFWQAIRRNLCAGETPPPRALPQALSRGGDLWRQWLSPDLLLSQTCGFPYRARLHGKVALVGTPILGLPGLPPGYYCSVMLTRRADARTGLADFAEAVLAYNEPMSQSGWAAPQTEAERLGFAFTRTLQTGSHRASALAVADGRADIAAIDALTWKMIRRWDSCATSLSVIGETAPTPTLPYISARGADTGALLNAIGAALDGLDPGDRDILGLTGITFLGADRYLGIPTPPAPAAKSIDAP